MTDSVQYSYMYVSMQSSYGTVFKVLGFHPANMGSFPSGTHTQVTDSVRRNIWPKLFLCSKNSYYMWVGMAKPL